MADVLMLCQRIPYPPDKGEKIRSYRVLERLTRRHRVHLGCLLDDPADRVHAETVRSMVASSCITEIDRRRARLWSLRGLLTHQGLSVTYFGDPRLRRWVRRTLETVRPQAVLVNSSNMAPYVLDTPARPPCLIADLVDVDSAKFDHYADTAQLPMRWVFRREAARVRALEKRLAAAADWSTLVSEPEADILRGMLGPAAARRVRAVSNGVDVGFFAPENGGESPYAGGGPVFCMTGHMDYRPNIDAACWFATEVLPHIRSQVPEARFAVVGANPVPEVKNLERHDGVLVTGRVPDVRPYIGHAAVSVAPLRIARGIQNKLLEAMAMGRPAVATTGALTGVAAEVGRDLLCADTAEGFAEDCLLALDPMLAVELGANARRFVVEHHSWETVLAPFDAMLPGGAARPAPQERTSTGRRNGAPAGSSGGRRGASPSIVLRGG